MKRLICVVLMLGSLAQSALTQTALAQSATRLPLGDGRVSTRPLVGNVFACETTFRVNGARHDGPWFHGDAWSPSEKPHVSGNVLWPEATLTVTLRGDRVEVRGNGLPLLQPSGVFPITPRDTVYKYDTNPNAIAAQKLSFDIPAVPRAADTPACVPMGMVGFTNTGVALFNALDAAGRDAAAHEIQDKCDGHPQGNALYHYHSSSPCLPGAEENKHVGWALDGYPIVGSRDSTGVLLTNSKLDVCHGRIESVIVDGRTYNYAYRLTAEYPYIIGCFHGQLSANTRRDIRSGLQPARRRNGPPN